MINSGIWLLLTYPNFWLSHYQSVALSPNFFSPHKSLPPGLLFLYNQHCIAGKVFQVLCLLHKQEGKFFILVQQKVSTTVCCFFRDKVGDTSSMVLSKAVPEGLRSVDRSLVLGATSSLNRSSPVQVPIQEVFES